MARKPRTSKDKLNSKKLDVLFNKIEDDNIKNFDKDLNELIEKYSIRNFVSAYTTNTRLGFTNKDGADFQEALGLVWQLFKIHDQRITEAFHATMR